MTIYDEYIVETSFGVADAPNVPTKGQTVLAREFPDPVFGADVISTGPFPDSAAFVGVGNGLNAGIGMWFSDVNVTPLIGENDTVTLAMEAIGDASDATTLTDQIVSIDLITIPILPKFQVVGAGILSTSNPWKLPRLNIAEVRYPTGVAPGTTRLDTYPLPASTMRSWIVDRGLAPPTSSGVAGLKTIVAAKVNLGFLVRTRPFDGVSAATYEVTSTDTPGIGLPKIAKAPHLQYSGTPLSRNEPSSIANRQTKTRWFLDPRDGKEYPVDQAVRDGERKALWVHRDNSDQIGRRTLRRNIRRERRDIFWPPV